MTEASPVAIHLAKQGSRGLRVPQRHSSTEMGEVTLMHAQLCPESSSISRRMQPLAS